MCPRGRPRGQGRPRGLHLCRLDPLVIACLPARRILHISAVIPHFGYKYNNVIPHRTPKI